MARGTNLSRERGTFDILQSVVGTRCIQHGIVMDFMIQREVLGQGMRFLRSLP